ncbi:ATP-binding cassette domain-containing protein [Streptomyces sp. MS19]|uniref:ATP-binding cassette domain-containing protein n=1 Tax=Streptomyces sp. MS19 TaxID=3385972 RepID=UPI0039A2502F
MTYAFRTTGLVKRFGDTTALAGVDLAARPGTVLGVLGPNGAGKTTAVRILATLLRPDGGQAEVAGYDVVRDAEEVRRRIGLTGQYASVDEDLTGVENLVMLGRLLDLSRQDARTRAAELLEQFDLTAAGGRRAGTYSGGMRRRLDLAASLIAHPEVVYLDEPTTGLDPAKRDDVWGLVRDQVAAGVTVLLTTQYLEEADALADEIAVIDHGSVIAQGTPHELKAVVGGQTLQVRPLDLARLGEVGDLLERVTGGRPDSPARGVLSVPVTGDAALPPLVARLAERGIEVMELSLRLPSLDEVFHSLTGGTGTATPAPTDSDTDSDTDSKKGALA